LSKLEQEIAELRGQLRRNHVYLVVALSVIGLSALVSVGLVGFYGWRLGDQMWELQRDVSAVNEDSHARTRALSLDLARQQRELTAIRNAATRDLTAIQEAHSKIASIRDPKKELTALREANQALWSALATQRANLLDAIEERDPEESSLLIESPETRFRLGETLFEDPTVAAGEVRGFIVEDEKVHRATSLPANPAHLLIELSPDRVALGQSYELEVRLVNRSNRALGATSLRIDWSFAGKKTGGDVPLDIAHVGANESAVLYSVTGRWTPAHEEGPVILTATLTLKDGERLANTLSWKY
jgi:hypothetical protein